MSRKLATIFYWIFLLVMATKSLVRVSPIYDIFAYEAIAASKFQPVPEAIESARNATMPYAEQRHEKYLEAHANVQDYASILWAYLVKPLYIELVRWVWRVGVPLSRAPYLIGSISFLTIGGTLLLWTKRPLLSLLVMLNPISMQLLKWPTPDLLATALALAGLFAVFRTRLTVALVLLSCATWVRPDFAGLALVCTAWWAVSGRMRASYAVVIGLLFIATPLVIMRAAGYPGFGAAMAAVHHLDWWQPHPALGGRALVLMFLAGLSALCSTMVPFGALLGVVAWRWLPSGDPAKLVLLVSAAQFLLGLPENAPHLTGGDGVYFEQRIYLWLILACAATFIYALQFVQGKPAQQAPAFLPTRSETVSSSH